MEISYKVAMQHVSHPDSWIVMAQGNKKQMEKLLAEYREFMKERKFRLEKHIMEVIDV